MSIFIDFFKKNILKSHLADSKHYSSPTSDSKVFTISSAKPSLSSEQKFRSFLYVFLMLSRVVFFLLAIFLYPVIPFFFVIVFIFLAAVLPLFAVIFANQPRG